MPLKKILPKPGVNRENTRYTTEGGWYDCDKIRFRQGTPEVIGGWQRVSENTYLGACRSLWSWSVLSGEVLTGVGTSSKFYVSRGGAYYDITPIRKAVTLTNPFTATAGSSVITVHDVGHGCNEGDYVTFYSATSLGGNITASVLNQNYKIELIDLNNYKINVGVLASGADTGHGGTTYAAYEIHVGSVIETPSTGWGAGPWLPEAWGGGAVAITGQRIRLWSQSNYGEDLIFGPSAGPIYYWDASLSVYGISVTISIASPAVISSTTPLSDGYALTLTTSGNLPTGLVPGELYYVVNSTGTTFNLALTPGGAPIATSGTQSGIQRISPRATALTDFDGANEVPLIQAYLQVSDSSRFVFAFGTNGVYDTVYDPMLIRWSDPLDFAQWEPTPTTQAGFIRLSHGSKIVTAIQTRQEIIVFTDSSVYSLQYIGPPYVWSSQLMGDNISILSQSCAAVVGNLVFWMGVDKFYLYDGTVKTVRCDLRRHIYSNINLTQSAQVFAGTNEGFNEIWWFYCSANSTVVDSYVIYNYQEDVWTYGTMGRTAWLDSGINPTPIAATYSNNIVAHETGVDDNQSSIPQPIHAYITSSEFDLDDGHNFSFVYRILPDLTFRGSTAQTPQVTMYLYTLKNSGSGYTTPGSVGGQDHRDVYRTVALPIEEFTGQIFTRVRGRQMAMKVESNQLGTTWQLGSPRIDIRPDGRR